MLPFLINCQMCPILSIILNNPVVHASFVSTNTYSTILKFFFRQNSRTLILLYSHYSGRPNPYVCVNQPGNSRAQCTKMCLDKISSEFTQCFSWFSHDFKSMYLFNQLNENVFWSFDSNRNISSHWIFNRRGMLLMHLLQCFM